MPDAARRLHQLEAPVEKVVATAFNLTIGLSDGRQITFQSGFEGDETDAAVNDRLDRMMRLADRQKARYEIPEVERNRAKIQETLANLEADAPRIEKAHQLAQEGRREQIAEIRRMCAAEIKKQSDVIGEHVLELQKQKQDALDRGQDEHQKRGKLAPYKPVGATKIEIDRIDTVLARVPGQKEDFAAKVQHEFDEQVAKVEAEIVKAENEREFTLDNLKTSVERWEKSLVDSEAELVRLQGLLGG